MSKIDWSQVDWYSRTRGPAMVGPSVAVNKSGRTVLNDEALSLVGNPEAFQVGIIQGGRGKTTLVLQAAGAKDAGSLKLTRQGKSKASLNTTKFFRDRGLEKVFESSGNPDVDEESNTLIVTL